MMKARLRPLACVLAISVSLGACTNPPVISNGGSTSTVESIPVLGPDLADTQFNLDQAVLIGALPPTDPVKLCVDAVLPPPPSGPALSFTSKIDGAVSAGSVIYIIAQQNAGAGNILESPACEQIIGALVIKGSKGLVPGGGLISAKKPVAPVK